MIKKKSDIVTYLLAMLIICIVLVPTVSAVEQAENGSQDESIGDPWFEKGDELRTYPKSGYLLQLLQ